MRAAALVVLAAIALPTAARAEPPRPLHYDLRVDGAATAGAALLYAASELAKESLAPSACRFCDPNGLDAGVRNALVWSDVGLARRGSDLLGYALVPAGMVAHQLLAARAAGDVEAGLVDALIVGEAAFIAMNVNQLVKLAVGRERPFVHYRNFADPSREPDPDDNLSFFSGHTTFTFALAAAAGTVSELRGYDSAPWVWTAGATLAATTAYLRIAADKHYLTDVLVGAVTGTAAGIALPRLLHGRKGGSTEPSGIAVVPFPIGVAFLF